MGIGDGMSPRIHPKSMDTLLEQHQAEILEDLNSLGRYSRSVSHRDTRGQGRYKGTGEIQGCKGEIQGCKGDVSGQCDMQRE